MFSFFWPYLRQYKLKLTLAIGLCAFVGVAVSYQNLILKYLLDDVLLIETISNKERYQRLAFIIGSYLLANIFFRSFFYHLSLRLFEDVRQKVVFAIRSHFFKHLNHLCLNFHNRHPSGELYSYMFGTPLADIQSFLHQLAMGLPSAAFIIVVTLIWLGFWDIVMTTVMAFYFLCHFGVMIWGHSHMHKLTASFQATEQEVISHVGDILRASRTVKFYSMEPQMEEQFALQARSISAKSYQRAVKSNLINMAYESNTYIFFAILATIGCLRFTHGFIEEGEFVAYLTVFLALQAPLNALFNLAAQRGQAKASVQRIQAMMAIKSTTPDPSQKQLQPCPRQGHFHLQSVHFAHGDKDILKDINLTIPYGQKIALVGPSGSGKSTLSQILLRLYDPQKGQITLDNCQLKEISGRDLRRSFGVVPQDPYIFNTTIRQNLRVIKPEAIETEIIDVCKTANAWEFIEKLPEGLDSLTGEGGSNLSGGQRQRLAIARALLCQPAYFVFDEATSALDSKSEQLIQEALEKATAGKTAIIIAHRLSTIKHCDRIIVMDEGRIVQEGKFEHLAKQPGLFQKLLSTDNSFQNDFSVY